MDPEQRALFDEAVAADIAAVETELEGLQLEDGKTPGKPPRRTSQRRALPPELPRMQARHEPESCTCGECGAALVLIGEHVSEKLDILKEHGGQMSVELRLGLIDNGVNSAP